ncbi:chromate transporter [Bradyrhizobium sp. ISRA435]|nr:chromate transporter [Bradyrhizobium sp. ISRA435]
MITPTIPQHSRLTELARYFLRLGFLGFGGPVALVGQMERELVDGKKWLTKDQMRNRLLSANRFRGRWRSRSASTSPGFAAAFGEPGSVDGASSSPIL